jgi:hypothetical protein
MLRGKRRIAFSRQSARISPRWVVEKVNRPQSRPERSNNATANELQWVLRDALHQNDKENAELYKVMLRSTI